MPETYFFNGVARKGNVADRVVGEHPDLVAPAWSEEDAIRQLQASGRTLARGANVPDTEKLVATLFAANSEGGMPLRNVVF